MHVVREEALATGDDFLFARYVYACKIGPYLAIGSEIR